MTRRERQTPEALARALPLDRLAEVLNRTTARLPEDDVSHAVWRVYATTRTEVYDRLAPHYGAVPDEELAAVLLMTMGKSSMARTGLEEVVAYLVEDEMRSRFPEASERSDEVLVNTALDDESVGEHHHLWVLFRESGVQL